MARFQILKFGKSMVNTGKINNTENNKFEKKNGKETKNLSKICGEKRANFDKKT